MVSLFILCIFISIPPSSLELMLRMQKWISEPTKKPFVLRTKAAFTALAAWEACSEAAWVAWKARSDAA